MAMRTILGGALLGAYAASGTVLFACGGDDAGSANSSFGAGGAGAGGAAAVAAGGNATGTGGAGISGPPGSGGGVAAAGGALTGGGAPGSGGTAGTIGMGGTPGAGGSGVGAGGMLGAGGDVSAGGTSGAGGVDGAGGAGIDDLAICESVPDGFDTRACKGSKTPNDETVLFGPYGAIFEYNVGQGFEVPKSASDTEAGCITFGSLFGEDPTQTAELMDLRDLDLTLYTVYRPYNWVEGETYPVITWGNGTCAQPNGYRSLLMYVASYGYVVFAANSRYTGSNGAMTRALDFAEAANADPNSQYYQKLDLTKIGAMGHSQGAGATATAASDSRIKTVILFNGNSRASKPFLAVSGDNDIAGPISGFRSSVQAAPPSAFIWYHQVPITGSASGHLTLMLQPERVVEATVAWFDMRLRGDETARGMFVGPSCGLCNHDAEFEFGQNGL